MVSSSLRILGDDVIAVLAQDRRAIGMAIKDVEYGWPVGMPLCRAISSRKGPWEVRVSLAGGRIARIPFYTHEGL